MPEGGRTLYRDAFVPVVAAGGLKLGASAASVVQALGKPLVVHACGMERYEYTDNNDPHSEANDLDFTIKNGRVIEIVQTSWG